MVQFLAATNVKNVDELETRSTVGGALVLLSPRCPIAVFGLGRLLRILDYSQDCALWNALWRCQSQRRLASADFSDELCDVGRVHYLLQRDVYRGCTPISHLLGLRVDPVCCRSEPHHFSPANDSSRCIPAIVAGNHYFGFGATMNSPDW